MWDLSAMNSALRNCRELAAMKLPTTESLVKRRVVTIADMMAKCEAEDWHGVADAAMDLREIDAMLVVIPVGFDPAAWHKQEQK